MSELTAWENPDELIKWFNSLDDFSLDCLKAWERYSNYMDAKWLILPKTLPANLNTYPKGTPNVNRTEWIEKITPWEIEFFYADLSKLVTLFIRESEKGSVNV